MPVSLDIQMPDLVKLNAMLAKMPAEIKVEQKTAMDHAIAVLVADAKAHVHTRRGNAPAGIKAKVNASGDTGRVNSTTKAARYSQRGRPGSEDGGRRWKAPKASTIARRFGLPPDEAFLVARAIGRKGTQGAARPIMPEVFGRNRTQVEDIFHQALERVVRSK